MTDEDRQFLEDLFHRVVRIESRLVQLIKYLGGDPYGKNRFGEFFEALEDRGACSHKDPSA